MQLDAELIDVAGDFDPLGFVLFELMLYIRSLVGNLDRVSCGRFGSGTGNHRWLATLLAIQRHPGRGGVDDE